MADQKTVQIGERIKKLRKARGFTQFDLAEKVGLAESTISLLEAGKRKPSLQAINKLAEIFNVDPAHFITTDNESEENPRVQMIARDLANLSDNDLDFIEKLIKNFNPDKGGN